MTDRLGIELGATTIRAVRLDGWPSGRARALEVPWDPEHPEDGVRALRETLGRSRRVGVALGLPLLFTKRVRLPPLAAAERRRMLRLEPQRYFPVRLEDLAIAVRQDDLVFAAREVALTAWVNAVEELGAVDLVEPGPVALARALAHLGIPNGVTLVDDAERGLGVIEVRDRALVGARRLHATGTEAVAALAADGLATGSTVYVTPWADERVHALAAERAEVRLEPLPNVGDVPGPFLIAYGAALGIGGTLDDALLSDGLGARIARRRRGALAIAGLGCVASVVFLLASADAWRARAFRELAANVEALERRSAPALALQTELGELDRRSRAVAHVAAQRTDPLRVLLALSDRLPAGAYLRALRFTGTEWQVDGYASQAAGVIGALGRAPEFRDVHYLAATNRVEIGGRSYESFTVAFRFASTP